MNGELTNVRKMRRLPWILAHFMGNSIFGYLTVFGAVFTLFLDAVGLNKQQVGQMLSILPFAGLVALIVAPWVARFGYKRTYILFYTVRKFVLALLIFTPWVVARYEQRVAFLFVAGVVLAFAICRAVAETAQMAWSHEYVPDTVRGRFSGLTMAIYTFGGVLAMAFASWVLSLSDQLWRFQWLIGTGVVCGLLSMGLAPMIPGGRPVRESASEVAGFRTMGLPLRNRHCLYYMGAVGLYALGVMPLAGFVPLFMKDQVGLEQSQVVLVDLMFLVGGGVAGWAAGWAADRFGGKPVCVVSVLLLMFFPLGLLWLPRHSPSSMPIAMVLMFLFGGLCICWHTAGSRVLFNHIIPAQHKSAYGATVYAWWGLLAGLGPLVAGWVIERSDWISGQWLGMQFDRYTPAMLTFLVLAPGAALMMSRIQAHGEMRAWSFVGMFFQGDPIQALSSAVSHSFAGDEDTRLSTTEQLGLARSALNVDELLDALDDPSFNVRHEAISAIARSRGNHRLITALIKVLNGNDPDLSLAAAWALGRLRDRAAVEPLRDLLSRSDYPLLAARCARALAMLGDHGAIPLLLARLRDEVDEGLRIAYASALGALRSPTALPELLAFLRDSSSPSVRQELTLALARLTGSEKNMVLLRRRVGKDRDTALAQAVDSLRRKTSRAYPRRKDLAALARRAAGAYADNDPTVGLTLLDQWVGHVSAADMPAPARDILAEARTRLAQFGSERIEYQLLVIDTLDKVLSHLIATRNRNGETRSTR